MKKLLIASILLCVQTFAQTPEKIYSINRQPHEKEYYGIQAKLWEGEVKKHPNDADAWKNYFNATRYYLHDKEEEKATRMGQIVADMEKHVPNTLEYYVCKVSSYDNSSKDTASYLKLIKKGLAINPNEGLLLDYYVNYCEINGHTENLKDTYTHLYSSGKYPHCIMECAYNILMSLDKNAIVFVDGDDDTYPMRILQEVKGIRNDVTIINSQFTAYPKYTKRLLKEININLPDAFLNKGQTVYDAMDFIKELVLEISKTHPETPIFFDAFCNTDNTFPDSLYCTGLAWKYSPIRINNIARLKNNIENHFHLDYLDDSFAQNDGMSEKAMEDMSSNYVTPFALLYKHYTEMGETSDRTEFYKNYIMKYAAKLGKQKEMEQFLQGKRGSI